MTGNKLILIAEDSPTQTAAIRFLLEEKGYRTIAAKNGKEALAAARKSAPYLIISDVMMPIMDGYQFCEQVKQDPKLQSVPFIMLTTLTDATDVIKGLEVGTDYYVTKPYNPEFLVEKIRTVLNTRPPTGGDKVEVVIDGCRKAIRCPKQRLFNLLLSTYENSVLQNRDLIRAQEERDQTNRELTQKVQELSLSEGRFSSLVQTIPDMVYRLDREGNFTFINQAVFRLGYSPEEVIGTHFSTIIYPPEVDRVSRTKVLPRYRGRTTGPAKSPKLFDERRSGNRKTSGLEVKLMYKSGARFQDAQIDSLGEEYLIAEVNSAGIHDLKPSTSEPVFLGTVGVIRDISKRKQLESDLENAYLECEEKVKRRTRELKTANRDLHAVIAEKEKAQAESRQAQEQLFQSQKLEAVGTLAGGIAHDFNNMLAAIIGYTELSMGDVPQDSPVVDSMNKVMKAAIRARNLVKQILSFSRQADQERRQVDMNLIAQEALEMIRASLPTTIEIQTNIDQACGKVSADPVRMHQVLINLCTNAAQAMGEEGGIIRVNLSHEQIDSGKNIGRMKIEPGNYLRLTVIDDGCGMDDVTLNRVFEPFFTTKEIGKGTGMGLAVVHGIVIAHKGHITVDSTPGNGSTFNVYLPVINEENSFDEERVTPGEIKGSGRILLVDDEEFLVEIGRASLGNLGYQVVAVTSSEEALAIFKCRPDDFDVVITDFTMPKMTGTGLAKAMLKIRPDLPIILCTGYSDHVDQEMATQIGIKRMAMKPLLAQEIARMIHEVVE